MPRIKTDRQRLGYGLFCLAISGAVIFLTLYRDASWSVDGIEAVLVLLPIGVYLVLKGGLGYDLLVDLRLRPGDKKAKQEDTPSDS